MLCFSHLGISLFFVMEAGVLSLRSVTFVGSEEFYAIAVNRGELVLDNVIVERCPIRVLYGRFSGVNSVFKNRTVLSALYMRTPLSAVIDNCRFDDTGGIYFTDSTSSNNTVHIKNSGFFSHKKAITSSTVEMNLVIENCSFIENDGTQYSLFSQFTNTRVHNSNFSGNVIGEYGVLTFAFSSEVEIQNCIFEKNSGYIGTNLFFQNIGKTIIDNSVFRDSISANLSNIYSTSGTEFSITNSIFENNFSPLGGSAFYFEIFDTGVISNSTFINNSMTSTAYLRGNSAVHTFSHLLIEDSYFSQNNGHHGAALSSLFGSLEVKGTTFEGNIGAFGADIFSYQADEFLVDSSIFKGSSLQAKSGASIYAYKGTSISRILNSEFSGYYANYSTIYAKYLGGIELIGCKITNNTGYYAPGIYTSGIANVLVKGTTCSNNHADFAGCFTARDVTNFDINGCKFLDNSAEEAGGVLYLWNSTGVVRNSTKMDSNTANFGGAVVSFSSDFTLSGSTIVNSYSGNNGGAIYAENSVLSLQNNEIKKNIAYFGAALWIINTEATISNSDLEDNSFVINGIVRAKGNSHLYYEDNTKIEISGAAIWQRSYSGVSIDNSIAYINGDTETEVESYNSQVTINTESVGTLRVKYNGNMALSASVTAQTTTFNDGVVNGNGNTLYIAGTSVWDLDDLTLNDLTVSVDGELTVYPGTLSYTASTINIEAGTMIIRPRPSGQTTDFTFPVPVINSGVFRASTGTISDYTQTSSGVFEYLIGSNSSNGIVNLLNVNSLLGSFGLSVSDDVFIPPFQTYTVISGLGANEFPSSTGFSDGYYFDIAYNTEMEITITGFGPTEVIIDDLLQGIDISFPRPVTPLDSNCSSIFDIPSLINLGSDPVCTWTSSTQLRVKSLDFVIGSSITFIHAALKDTADSSFFVWGTFDIKIPRNPPSPISVIIAPSNIPACQDLTLDGSASYVSKYSRTYKWQILSGHSSPELIDILNVSSNSVTIPYEYLTNNIEYIFSLEIINPFGIDFSTVSVTSVLDIPDVYIEGSRNINIVPSIDFQVNGRIRIPPCINESSVQTTWTQTTGTPIDLTSLVSSMQLVFPAYTLEYGTYGFTFESCFTSELCNSQDITVIVTSSPIAVYGYGGGSLALNKDINLEAVVVDPDLTTSTVYYTWNLITCAGNSVVSPSTDADTANQTEGRVDGAGDSDNDAQGSSKRSLGSKRTATETYASLNPNCAIFGAYTTPIISEGKSLSVLSSLLVEGEYVFVVTAEKDGRKSSDTVTVYIGESENIPTVQIVPIEKVKMNKGERIVIKTVMDESIESIAWTSYDPSVELQSSWTTTGLNSPTLVFSPNSLTAGNTYYIQVEGTDNNGNIGFDRIILSINSGPTGGNLMVSPESGYQLETQFTLKSDGWIDDATDLPLRATFYANGNLLTDVMNTFTLSNISIPVAGDSTENYTVTISVEIRDLWGAISTAETEIQVLPSSEYSQDDLDGYLNIEDYRSAGLIISGIANGLIDLDEVDQNLLRIYIIDVIKQIENKTVLTSVNVHLILQTVIVVSENPDSFSEGLILEVLDILLIALEDEHTDFSAFSANSLQAAKEAAKALSNLLYSPVVQGNAEIFETAHKVLVVLGTQLSAGLVGGEELVLDGDGFSVITIRVQNGTSVSGGEITLVNNNNTNNDGSLQIVHWNNYPFEKDGQDHGEVISINYIDPTTNKDIPFGEGDYVIFNIAAKNTTDSSAIFCSNSVSGTCEWYDITSNSWSSEGCTTTENEDGSYTCQCSHLTDFTVLYSTQTCDDALYFAILGSVAGVLVVAGVLFAVLFSHKQKKDTANKIRLKNMAQT
eukprot:TRINITY_DN4099_c0_g1_i3.p1 TRINITY_DN4099_c0_g1~~TRINITY_DN4099_c0_g1_i3.p1  ORF type:complete len:1837 (-),score=378.78 TRINITY_DN4099_c0_g1_i3:41-5551(-)